MAKVKTKKHDTFIDMTAMSDMMVLLLTFFMLTATFMPQEPVQVTTPSSVSETSIAEYQSTMVLIDPQGRVFLHFSTPDDRVKILEAMGKDYGIAFTQKQKITFRDDVTHAGVPMKMMSAFLDLPLTELNNELKKYGVPTDSVDNQFARWIRHARAVDKDMTISIKADQSTEYPKVDKILKILVDIKENRYSLVTTLTGMPSGF